MKNLKIIPLFLLALTTIVACNRTENTNTSGKGGSAVLNCTPTHHGSYTTILNSKIFIKYNTQNIPDQYDDSAICILVAGKPTAIFNELKSGSYYIAATGFDSSISQNVKGGIPYKIESEGSINIEIPVTETH